MLVSEVTGLELGDVLQGGVEPSPHKLLSELDVAGQLEAVSARRGRVKHLVLAVHSDRRHLCTTAQHSAHSHRLGLRRTATTLHQRSTARSQLRKVLFLAP